VREEYSAFLKQIGVEARTFVPISARPVVQRPVRPRNARHLRAPRAAQ
jgi:hypothetical protein